jgi:predicted unusual protein kinase regulating ubiquinone biosynthesis (AarF/ABC1/UbiB family)
VGTTIFRLTQRELFQWRFVQTDPNFANYLVDPGSGRVGLLDLGGAREYEKELTDGFGRLLAAGLAGDRDAILRASIELGFLDEKEPAKDAFVDICLLIAEPLHAKQPFDFGESDLTARVNRARFELVLEHHFLRAPPPKTLFLLRKLAGTWFLCARLRARVDVRGVVEPFL